jgi:hypothetical protein
VVVSPGKSARDFSLLRLLFTRVVPSVALFFIIGCATDDAARLKAGRELFSKGEFDRAESELYSSEVLERKESRLQHFLWLASLGVNQGSFEKALYYSNRARELALNLRSDRGGFEWLSSEYKSNPIEYSYLHYFLLISNLILAETGKTASWSIPELKLKNGTILVPAQSFPARTYSPREIAEFRTRARAELRAWDQFLVVLKRTYPDMPFYKEDILARFIGSFVHGGSSTREERRTGELLGAQGIQILSSLTGVASVDEHQAELQALFKRLMERADSRASEKDTTRLVLIESGVMPELKVKRVVVGLSTIFERIEDPHLRLELERLGLQVLFQLAPEFGMIAFSGAVAGAVGSGSDDPPKSLSGAIDRSFGFEVSFPTLDLPKTSRELSIILTAADGKKLEHSLQPIGPIGEILMRELKQRTDQEWSAKAVKIGLQYLAILVPAVAAYRDAMNENDLFKKLAILAGFYIAKKAIDRANSPDLRSWSLLPELISGTVLKIPSDTYGVEILMRQGEREKKVPLGEWKFDADGPFLLHRRVFDSGAQGL